jgi:hypothetical protein
MTDLVRWAADHFRRWNRRRKAGQVRRLIDRNGVRSVLLVGVSRGGQAYANQVEEAITAHAAFVVWSGLETGGGRDYVAADGLRLPFRDGAFDLVFSNAVIEHVGDAAAQRQFVDEHARVGRSWVLTTPNRWFPVESHTNVVFRHWSRAWRARRGEFTRLLNRRELRVLLPGSAAIEGSQFAPTFMAMG